MNFTSNLRHDTTTTNPRKEEVHNSRALHNKNNAQKQFHLNAVFFTNLHTLKSGGNARATNTIKYEVNNAVHDPFVVVSESHTKCFYVLAILNAWTEVRHEAL